MRNRCLFIAAAITAAGACLTATAPVFAGGAPPAPNTAPSSTAAPVDKKATIVRYTLQLQRADDIAGVPVAPIVVVPVPPPPVAVAKTTGNGTTATTTVTLPAPTTAPVAPLVPGPATPVLLASPVLVTFDNNTASLAVAGGDLSYTLSLAPTVAPDGKVVTLWNIRLGGRSLPGATTATATGAARVETGKNVVIAEISLTDPVSGRRATFVLQGVVVTGDAAAATAAPAAAPAAIAPAP